MKTTIIIDGQMVQTARGSSILEASEKAGITIPTLCYHGALKPYGSCRLCVVEVVQNKQRRLVTSCNVPVETGMEITTDNNRVRQVRKMVVELLLARCPEVPMVRNLAKRLGIESSQLKKKGSDDCILCGLCVRFCEEVVSVSAIGLSNRGTEREVCTPFKDLSDVCIGCGSCTYICPTGCIEMIEDDKFQGMRKMNAERPSLKPCPNAYDCASCDIDSLFMEQVRNEIGKFRNTYNKA